MYYSICYGLGVINTMQSASHEKCVCGLYGSRQGCSLGTSTIPVCQSRVRGKEVSRVGGWVDAVESGGIRFRV
jgi:hypothetical protein